MRPEDVCTMCLKLLEMLPSKRRHNAFKWFKWKCFIDVQNLCSRLKTNRLQNVFISTFKSHDLKSSTKCLQVLSIERLPNVLWCLQIINVLVTSSTGLWNIWNCNFKLLVKYWIRLEYGFRYAALQRKPWRLVRVPAGNSNLPALASCFTQYCYARGKFFRY